MSEPRNWWTAKAAVDGKSADVFIYDVIGEWGMGKGIAARSFVQSLREHDGKKLNVRINSLGGLIFDGLCIFNWLDQRGNVDTYNDGIAASISSVIYLAGKNRYMARNAQTMVHNPSGIAWGTSEEMRKSADVLDQLKGSILATYSDKTGRTEKELSQWMDAETWFSADESKDAGFCTAISGEMAFAAHADASRFRNYKPTKTIVTPMSGILSGIGNLLNGPSDREKFAVGAIVALGLTEAQFDDAAKTGKPEFLNVLISGRIQNLTNDNATLKSDQTAKAGRIADLERQLGEATAKVTDLTGKLTAAETTAATATTAATTATTTAAAATATAAAAVASVPIKAQELLGQTGMAPIPADKGATGELNDKELVDHLNSLKGKPREHTAFYNKHEKRFLMLAAAQSSASN